MDVIRILMVLTFLTSHKCAKFIDYERRVVFSIFNNATGERGITTFDNSLRSHGCGANDNYAIVVHGWKESISTQWVMETILNLMYHRGGCVIFMDYSNFSIVADYFVLTPHFHGIAEILLRKIKQIGNYDRLFLFGFSFGSRLCFEAGARLGNQRIERIDACDPAGPWFDGYKRSVDPKLAAKNVACINTSVDKGTSIYNCHQNFRMGNCGKTQIGSTKKPFRSHGLCPYFYNSAFTNTFAPTLNHNCSSKRAASNIPKNLIMGYMNQVGSSQVFGDIFVPTAKRFPWNVVNNFK